METDYCWVCREKKKPKELGDGMKCPKTTCWACFRKHRPDQMPKKKRGKTKPVKALQKLAALRRKRHEER